MAPPVSRKTVDRVMQSLWPQDGSRYRGVWALLDGSRGEAVHKLLQSSYRSRASLFSGRVDPALMAAGPFLLELGDSDFLTRSLIQQGWGASWGVFLRSDAGLRQLKRHFAGLLRVRDERHRRLFFRFYDPRVLRTYLPTCRADELRRVFGPTREFLMEGAVPDELLRFTAVHPIAAPLEGVAVPLR